MTVLATVQAVPMNAWHQGGWGWWFPFGLIFWLGLIALAVYFVTRVRRSQPVRARGAQDILAERFARGEIDSEEYEERRSHLD